jgi:hypothetical protein
MIAILLQNFDEKKNYFSNDLSIFSFKKIQDLKEISC